MSTKDLKLSKIANDYYQECTGTENYYKHNLAIHFTDGIKEVADKEECYWLIDVVASYSTVKFKETNPFQVWQLKRIKGNKFKVSCEDGNENILITQNIPFSDFKYDEIKMFLVDGILMLPSEY